jgi:hypothetical protein
MIAAVRLEPPGYHSAAPAVGALVVVALIAVLVAAELLAAHGSPRALLRRRRLTAAAVPLALCSILVVAARLAPVLH